MFGWLFGYKADPATKVEVWITDIFGASEEAAKGNRTLVRTTTWKDYEWKKFCHLNQEFGPGDTLVTCWVRTETDQDFFACTPAEFIKRSQHIPVRSLEERDAWFDRIIEAQAARVKELDQISLNLDKLLQDLQELREQISSTF